MLGLFVRRRPSAAMVVSLVALFVALGGAGWAAFRLPPKSVGTAQLRNRSVTSAKLRSRAVGKRQINSGQVQLRVVGSCPLAAIQTISSSGKASCGSAPPPTFGASAGPVTVGATATQVVSKALPNWPWFLMLAFPRVSVTGNGTAQQVTTTCTLGVYAGSSVTESQTTDFAAPANGTESFVLPLALQASVLSEHGSGGAAVSCSYTATGNPSGITESVASNLDAIETLGTS
jgi:hypothetical protein